MPALISTATVAAVGLACKTFLYSGYCGAVTVTGLSHLVEALHDEERNRGQGIITGTKPSYLLVFVLYLTDNTLPQYLITSQRMCLGDETCHLYEYQ